MFVGRVFTKRQAFSVVKNHLAFFYSKHVHDDFNFKRSVGIPSYNVRNISRSPYLYKGEMASGKTETGTHKNRLANERSPYLLQHAANPVDWFPWGEEAFAKARAEDKLIFLSVGYSTCHWCHVMERESFENESVASIMNDYFINIKVDREERPDVDKIYMTFVQASSGSGGWPMSVFLTPDLKPVAGGTYFPPKDSYGRPGFKTVLLNIAQQWAEQRPKVSATGTRITELLKQTTVFDVGIAGALIGGEVPGKEVWELCTKQLFDSYEPVFGGFSNAPKFPQPSNFSYLFHVMGRSDNPDGSQKAKEMALHSLDRMADGGIHDHVSQGFARYSTDSRWHVPHFEKMLYDQAQLAVAYTDAYLVTKNKKYSNVVRDILTYVSRDLSHPDGGFFSAEDADSYPLEGGSTKREGAFCIWKHNEITSLLDQPTVSKPKVKLSDVFCHHYFVKPEGNVNPEQDPHNELQGQNVLAVFGNISDSAYKFGLSEEELVKELEIARKILFDARQKRPRPHLDDKIITSWNGLMISGFAQAASALNEEDYKARAIAAATFVKKHLYTEDKRLLRSCYTEGGNVVQIKNPIEGFVDDYACLIRGLIDLYECSFNEDWLIWANELQAVQDELFWDHGLAGYFSTSSSDTNSLFRLKEDQDGAEPSGNSVSAGNLVRLSTILDCADMKDKAAKLLSSFTSRLTRVPLALPEMVSALMLFHDSPTQVVVTGDLTNPETAELVNVARQIFTPGLLVMTTGGNPNSFLATKNQAVRKMKQQGERQAVYVCRGKTCSLPVSTPAELADLLRN